MSTTGDSGRHEAPRDDTRTQRGDTQKVRHDATREHGHTHGEHAHADREPVSRRETAAGSGDRQRERYGGFNFGAAFFGWLVAIALTVLLGAVIGAIAAAVGESINLQLQDIRDSGDSAAIISAAVLLVLLAIAYFAGGYVAGRMSRFDGGRQGFGVWLLALIVSALLVLAGLLFGSEYNLLQQIPNIPTVPVDTDALTLAGVIALVVVLLVTLLAAVLGGKAGQRYHTKVDRAARA